MRNMRRIGYYLFALSLLLCGWARAEEAWAVSVQVRACAFGPGVCGVIIRLEPAAEAEGKDVQVTTGGVERQVARVLLCDEQGRPVQAPSDRVLLALSDQHMTACPLFETDSETGHQDWVRTYEVSVEGSLILDGAEKRIAMCQDSIGRRVCADSDLFSARESFTQEELNPMSGRMEIQTIRLAAYEPETLQGGAPNPLIVWLHGAGEGGTNLDVAVLGNEVTLLAKEAIQRHFTSEDGVTGAYVLLPQCETLWMDEGDGENWEGTGVSRYTKVLMDAIAHYVESHPDVDRNRVYLGGCSNGGYMTLNLLTEYPGFFAAAFPVCEAYDTSDQPQRIAVLAGQSIWFVHSADDHVVDPGRYVIPTYVDLVFEEAEDCWLSMFDGYRHAVWNAVFHDLVNGVQDPDDVFENSAATPDREKGGAFTAHGVANLFDWLGAHALSGGEK